MESNDIERVVELIAKGADDSYALRLASKNGHLKLAKLLIENGADVHANSIVL